MNNPKSYILYKTLIDNILSDFGINPVYCMEIHTVNEFIPTEYNTKIVCNSGVCIYLKRKSDLMMTCHHQHKGRI